MRRAAAGEPDAWEGLYRRAYPNRISAGTFHPDAQGRTDVELTAAVDPTDYPEVSVTAEPGDGDPGPSGTEVLRAPVRLR